MPKLGPNPTCAEVKTRYDELVKLSKTRSKASNRDAAAAAAVGLQQKYPLCWGDAPPQGEPALPGQPSTPAIPGQPVIDPSTGQPVPMATQSGFPLRNIVYAVLGVAALGTIAYIILKPNKKGPPK